MNKYKLDLHIHSILSSDGGIDKKDLEYIFENKILDYIAITDHNEVEFAQSMQEYFPGRIIVGEEIKTSQGEIIGLYLKEKINKGMTIAQTLKAIKAQGGLSYIPHPYSERRHGIGPLLLDVFHDMVDFIESYNGRAILGISNKKAIEFVAQKKLVHATNSDAHSKRGIGKVYNLISAAPTKETLVSLLESAEHITGRAPIAEYLSPTLNRLSKRFK